MSRFRRLYYFFMSFFYIIAKWISFVLQAPNTRDELQIEIRREVLNSIWNINNQPTNKQPNEANDFIIMVWMILFLNENSFGFWLHGTGSENKVFVSFFVFVGKQKFTESFRLRFIVWFHNNNIMLHASLTWMAVDKKDL